MTVQEAINQLQVAYLGDTEDIVQAKHIAITAIEEVEKLRFENRALKNRCYILTRGAMCLFCPINCSDREVDFRGNEDEK